MSPDLEKMLRGNREWADALTKDDPEYFEKLSKGQSPGSLVIGCSDSRIPVSTIMNAAPGEIFIHRNIANSVSPDDKNLLSVLEYAVEDLGVKNIIILGHYRCGGIKTAVEGADLQMVTDWVSPIRNAYLKKKEHLENIEKPDELPDRLSEINVIMQLENLALTPVMKNAFSQDSYPELHGWIFDIYTGRIRKLDLPFERWIKEGIVPGSYLFKS
jgi:carbonic anhydrase